MEKPKPKKLTSSVKSIHKAIASFIPVARICIHQSRTHSFRDLYPTPRFDSIYYISPSPSNHSSVTTISSSSSHHHRPMLPTRPACHPDDDSSDASTSSFNRKYEETPTSVLPVETCISSTRFFFSPRTTKSIMEERKLHLGHRKVSSFDAPSGRNPPEPVTRAGSASGGDCFCKDSMVVTSEDPYRHFRVSMEEMVEAHGLKDWSRLQQLVHCYLLLNDKKIHPIIMLAFIDLLVHFHNENNSSFSYSSPLL